jgi:hypothetical protein
MLNGIDVDALLLQDTTKMLIDQLVQSLENGELVAELLENHLSMRI